MQVLTEEDKQVRPVADPIRPPMCAHPQVHVLKGALGLRNDAPDSTLDRQAQLLHNVAQVCAWACVVA